MKTQTTITIEGNAYELSDEFLSHVLQTAVEGACSYWADAEGESEGGTRGGDFDLTDYVEDDEEAEDDEAPFYQSASFLVADDPSQGGSLDLQGVADAIERIANGEAEVEPAIRAIIVNAVQNEDASDIDAEAADCIVQVGLFDEVVYE